MYHEYTEYHNRVTDERHTLKLCILGVHPERVFCVFVHQHLFVMCPVTMWIYYRLI